ncbi:MAG: hypothetical protein M3R48_07140 [Candidatus Dormibacteraeota bacterium]|nr:hypothetical protein [Candidatus Dormibacteraeota bacterium]
MDLDDGRSPRAGLRRPAPPQLPAPPGPRLAEPPLTIEDLHVYELNGDGHTICRHCDTTPGADAVRLAENPWVAATGSFLSVAVAQDAVQGCVDANRDEVVAWRHGDDGRRVITHDTGAVIGDVLRRRDWLAGDVTPVPATAVLVVLRRNPSYPSGFAVRTAYPVRTDAPATIHPTRIPLEEHTP